MSETGHNLPLLRDVCELHPDVHDLNRSEQVEHLDLILRASRDEAQAFFAKTHLTAGMSEFLRGALRRVSGQSSQAIFELRQAMGGGKTHNLIALGLIASNPDLLTMLPEQVGAGLTPSRARIAAINGRDISHDAHLWGDIARQLGREDMFRKFWIDGPKKVNESDWSALLGDQPNVILLDELPPHFAMAHTQPVGQGTLLDLLKYNLANLLSAAMKAPKTVVVIASLDAAYDEARQILGAQLQDLQQETSRGAKSITPVDLNTGEVYDILRKRLFTRIPGPEVADRVASAYGSALREAVQGKALRKGADLIADDVPASYPFHPGYKNVLSLFKENPKFRQTRGLIEFTANVLRGVWASEEEIFMAGAEHADFANAGTRDQVKDIERSLEAALASDVYDTTGSAHAQDLDAERGGRTVSMVATLLYMSSLSDNTDGVRGLSQAHIAEMLTGPGRAASVVLEAFDALKERCWYLHSRDGDRFYFSDVANVRKQIEDKLSRVDPATVDQTIRNRLQELFAPRLKTAYQDLLVMPEIREIRLTAGRRTCLVLSPDAKSPPEAAQRFFEDQVYKNAFLVVSGDGSRMGNLAEIARRLVAIEAVASLVADTPRHQEEIGTERTQALTQFQSTVLALFNTVWHPLGGKDGARLNPVRLDFSPHQEKGKTDGEAAIAAALAGSKKLVEAGPEGIEALMYRCEDMLFPNGQSRSRWSDLLERAASNPRWVWTPPKGLDAVKTHALSIGRWAEADGYVDKSPPPPQPKVTLTGTRFDARSGESEIEFMVTDAGTNPQVIVSTDPDVYATGTPVEGRSHRTSEVELWFGVTHGDDPAQRGEPKAWKGRIALTHDRQVAVDHYLVTLTATPDAEIRWNLTGINEKEGQVYDGSPIRVPADGRTTLYAYAKKGGVEARERFLFEEIGKEREIRDEAPAEADMDLQMPDLTAITRALTAAKAEPGTTLSGVRLTVGSGEDGITVRCGAHVGTGPEDIETLIGELRRLIGDPDAPATLRADGARFPTGYALKSFAEKAGVDIPADCVSQGVIG
jgi:hypothetical protein